jgi:hypothetical protein
MEGESQKKKVVAQLMNDLDSVWKGTGTTAY